jgi:hypothetical protein
MHTLYMAYGLIGCRCVQFCGNLHKVNTARAANVCRTRVVMLTEHRALWHRACDITAAFLGIGNSNPPIEPC